MLKNFLPRDFYQKCLESKTRPDHRDFDEYREVNLKSDAITCAHGSSLVKIGHTLVTCGIKGKVVAYDEKAEFKLKIVDFIDIKVQFPPICQLQWKNNLHSNDYTQYVQQSLIDAIDSAKILSPEDMLILNNKYIWTLSCDIICLNDAGNVYDAALISLMTALKKAKFPDLDRMYAELDKNAVNNSSNFTQQSRDRDMDADDQSNLPSQHKLNDKSSDDLKKIILTQLAPLVEKEGSPKKCLSIRTVPISTSFIYFENNLMVDPTSQEENLASGRLIITLTGHDSIPFLYKTGSFPLSPQDEKSCMAIANKHSLDVRLKIKNMVADV